MPDVLTHLLFGISLALLLRRDDSRPQQMLIVPRALQILSWRLVGHLLNEDRSIRNAMNLGWNSQLLNIVFDE